MTLRQWAGGAIAITAVSMSLAGCGGGGGGVSLPAAPADSFTGASSTKSIAAPTVSDVQTNAETQQLTVTLTDPATGTQLTNVVVPADADLQPKTGKPALVLKAGDTKIGATFGATRATAADWVSLYRTGTTTPALKARLAADGTLLDSVALGGTGTFTLRFENVTAIKSASRSLVIDALNFTFQVRSHAKGLVTTLPTNFQANLPAFGEKIAPDPTKKGWQAGGIQFGVDAVAKGGVVSLGVSHANGTIKRTEVLGNAGTQGGQAITTILMGDGGSTMGKPCHEVNLQCVFPQ